jgi:hypothetical protein
MLLTKLALTLVGGLLIWPTIGKPFMAPVQEGGFKMRDKNTQKMFKLLGTPYDVKAQKVSILSLIVDQSHSIIKKRCISKV